MSGPSTREQLTHRLRTVWPDPIPIGVSRSPRRHAGLCEEYLVLPTMSRPVFLIPADNPRAAAALARSDDGQKAPVLTRAIEIAHRRGLLRKAPGVARVTVPGAEGVMAIVRQLVPDADAVVIKLGRPRHGRTVVLQALDRDGRSLAFAKCGRDEAIGALRTERDNLHQLAERPVPGVTSPPVLGWAEYDGAAVLALGPLVPDRPAAATGAPVAAMLALSGRNGRRDPVPLGETPLLRRLRQCADALAAAVPDAGWLAEHAALLADQYSAQLVTVGSWHGDWVPWNMARDGEQVLLWDWEHLEGDVLAGFDHLHYLAQTHRMREGIGPDAEDAWLAASRTAMASDWAMTETETEVAIAAYLLLVNERYVADRVGAPPPTADRAGWSRDLLDGLLRGTR